MRDTFLDNLHILILRIFAVLIFRLEKEADFVQAASEKNYFKKT